MNKEIVVFTNALGNDGAERVLSELIENWIKKGVTVTLVQREEKAYGVSYYLPESVEIVNLKNHGHNVIEKDFWRIKDIVSFAHDRPDAVFVSFITSTIRVLAMASFFIKNKIVFSERNDPRRSPPTSLHRLIRYLSFLRADVCVFQTHEAMSCFPKRAQKKGVIIYNPINCNLPTPCTSERNKTIVNASRLTPQKNLPMLLKAFAKLSREFPEYRLEIYGQGEDKDTLTELIEELGIKDKAFLCGFSSDIHNIINRAYMYVTSSDYEGISNSMLEALAMGVPTISTDCPVGGAREMISDGENGLLVPVGDTEALYSAMKYLIENPEQAQFMGQEASKIRDKYPIDIIADKWLSLM